MQLKELPNLFNEIDYFNSLENKDDYYQEFIFLYGDRVLLSKIEELYINRGISNIGKLFKLKTRKWFDLYAIEEKIETIEKTDKTVVTTGSKNIKGDRTRQTNSNNTNEVTPFDVVESVDNEKTTNTLSETENNTDNSSMENKTVYSGFSKDRINHFIKKFENYKEYRYIIYKDIVNMITLQIYD